MGELTEKEPVEETKTEEIKDEAIKTENNKKIAPWKIIVPIALVAAIVAGNVVAYNLKNKKDAGDENTIADTAQNGTGNVADISLDILDTFCLVVSETTLESLLVDIIEDDVLYSGCNECFSNVETNSVRCAGNPGVFAFKAKWICHSIYFCSIFSYFRSVSLYQSWSL